MVSMSGGSTSDEAIATLGKDVCMHVVFSKPPVLSREQFDESVIEKEREVLLAAAQNDPKNAKKNEEILGKIVEGQINKFIASKCLVEQEFIKDDQKRSVGKSIEASGTGVKIESFAYIATDAD
jgi:elongation factor Ts